jgi:hypothetical protein
MVSTMRTSTCGRRIGTGARFFQIQVPNILHYGIALTTSSDLELYIYASGGIWIHDTAVR